MPFMSFSIFKAFFFFFPFFLPLPFFSSSWRKQTPFISRVFNSCLSGGRRSEDGDVTAITLPAPGGAQKSCSFLWASWWGEKARFSLLLLLLLLYSMHRKANLSTIKWEKSTGGHLDAEQKAAPDPKDAPPGIPALGFWLQPLLGVEVTTQGRVPWGPSFCCSSSLPRHQPGPP